MEFEKVLKRRVSCRSYLNGEVTKEQLQKIVDAAQIAPTALADYTKTHITVVSNKQLLDDIRSSCMFPKKDGTLGDPTYGVSALIILSATGPSEDSIEYCNIGCAIENMLLQATDMGLGSIFLWGYIKKLKEQPELIERLNIPKGYTILSSIGIGISANEFSEREIKQNIKVNWVE